MPRTPAQRRERMYRDWMNRALLVASACRQEACLAYDDANKSRWALAAREALTEARKCRLLMVQP